MNRLDDISFWDDECSLFSLTSLVPASGVVETVVVTEEENIILADIALADLSLHKLVLLHAHSSISSPFIVSCFLHPYGCNIWPQFRKISNPLLEALLTVMCEKGKLMINFIGVTFLRYSIVFLSDDKF